MSLINQALLFGLAFAAIPLVLHLMMKSKPKKVLFPALRLIQMRKKTNTRRLQLRHIWLLLLRTLLLALLVLAIARPSLPAANYGLSWTELLTFGGIIAAGIGAYYWLQRKWKQQSLPNHELRYKRTVLRGGTGGAIALLTLLLVGLPYGKRIAAEISGESASELSQNVPVAAVFLFDSSLSMDYRLENKTRLEEARGIAAAHLSSLPTSSRVCITDSADNREMVFQGDLISAGARIDAIKTHPGSSKLNARLSVALGLQNDDRKRVQEELGISSEDADAADGFVREIYIFTDFARSAWQLGNANLKAKLDAMPWVHAYFIDVSVDNPINVGVTDLRLSQQSVTRGQRTELSADIAGTGVDGLRTAELYINDETGTPVLKEKRTVKLNEGAASRVSFSLLAPDRDFVQGEVRLVSSDPFVGDDVRYFTAGLNQPPRVLLLGDSWIEARFLSKVLAPDDFVKQGAAPHQVTYRSMQDVGTIDFAKYNIICMVNARAPETELWGRLKKFVSRGGGLAVFLGNSEINPANYNSAEAQEILPATLSAAVRFFKGPFIVDLQNTQHPLFRRIVDNSTERAEFSGVEYTSGWVVEPMPTARVLASYNNERALPAWLDITVGEGQTVMFTNGMDNIGDNDKAWSDLTGVGTFMRVSYELMHYLGHYADGSFNWISGQDPIVRFDRDQVQEKYLLAKPSLQQLPGQIPKEQNFVVLTDANAVGHYRFSSGTGENAFVSGFSTNSDDSESDFTQVTDGELTTLLGEDRYTRAREIEELDRAVQNSRLGREVFPLLMVLVVLFFIGEHIVANHFYDQGVSAAADPDKRSKVAA